MGNWIGGKLYSITAPRPTRYKGESHVAHRGRVERWESRRNAALSSLNNLSANRVRLERILSEKMKTREKRDERGQKTAYGERVERIPIIF